jgi:hypothetical protein
MAFLVIQLDESKIRTLTNEVSSWAEANGRHSIKCEEAAELMTSIMPFADDAMKLETYVRICVAQTTAPKLEDFDPKKMKEVRFFLFSNIAILCSMNICTQIEEDEVFRLTGIVPVRRFFLFAWQLSEEQFPSPRKQHLPIYTQDGDTSPFLKCQSWFGTSPFFVCPHMQRRKWWQRAYDYCAKKKESFMKESYPDYAKQVVDMAVLVCVGYAVMIFGPIVIALFRELMPWLPEGLATVRKVIHIGIWASSWSSTLVL